MKTGIEITDWAILLIIFLFIAMVVIRIWAKVKMMEMK